MTACRGPSCLFTTGNMKEMKEMREMGEMWDMRIFNPPSSWRRVNGVDRNAENIWK